MKICMIHGQNHKGSTYHIGRMLSDKLGGEVTEFFLPRDFGEFCCGCTQCFMKSEKLCPHYEKLNPITEAIDCADVLIFTSPVYVYHCTGSMKAFLDHYGWRWIVHRPEEKMFSKQAVAISTAAGAGMKSTNKDITDSFFFWGVGKCYSCGTAVMATSWNEVKPEKKRRIEARIDTIASQIKKNHGRVKPSLKTKAFFELNARVFRGISPVDKKYWNDKGWAGKVRPWKKPCEK